MIKKNFIFTITIVFDNRCVNNGYLTGFGFSALILNNITQNYILFDTGGNINVLIHNIKKTNVKISEIKKLVISHNHHDHLGGLEGFYNLNPNIEIFAPNDLTSYKKAFPEAKLHSISELTEIEKKVFLSGQLGGGFMKEQALFLETKDNQFVLIVGCTHPGLENFISKAQKTNKIKAIIGGFHGFREYSYLEGIDFIIPCHCTQNVKEIQKRYPNQFKKICVGDSFKF